MEITRTAIGGLFLSQSLYLKDVLKRFADRIGANTIKFNKSVNTMDHNIKYHKGGAINLKFKEDPVEIEKNGEKVLPNTPYREVVGFLLWLANGSRPDIFYSVAKYCCDPRIAHLKACKKDSKVPCWYPEL